MNARRKWAGMVGRWVIQGLIVVLVVYIAYLFVPQEDLNLDFNLPWRVVEAYAFELRTFDTLLKISNPIKEFSEKLNIVGVDAVSLTPGVIGPWPWSRGIHANLVNVLRDAGAAAIGFDFTFVDPSQEFAEGDDSFVRALRDKGRTVLACKVGIEIQSAADKFTRKNLDTDAPVDVLPAFAQASAGVGFIDVDDRYFAYDGTIRVTRLARKQNGHWVPSLDLAVFAVSQNVKLSDIRYEYDHIQVGSFRIPTNNRHEFLIPYFVPEHDEFDPLAPIPYARVIGAPLPADYVGTRVQVPKELIKGGVFLVGAWATDLLGDTAGTPMGQKPGIWVHAQILNALMQQKYILPTPLWVYIASMLLPAFALMWILRRVSAPLGLLLTFGTVAGIWFASYELLGIGWWFRPLGPSVTIAVGAGLVAAYQFIRGYNLLRQYITPELAHDLLLAGGEAARTVEHECTVIFSDIRGFTTLNESMPPSKMVELLREYHSLTVPIYERNGGRCLDYLGDAQMVVYGDPMSEKRAVEKNHAVAALRAALEVHEAIEKMNRRWAQRGDPPFEVGIGCCSGIVAVGVLGADTAHLQYTCIGDVTNTAARVQGLSRDLDAPVIATQSTIEKAGEVVVSEAIKSVELKGKSKNVMVYRVLGMADDPRMLGRKPKAMAATVTSILIAVLGMWGLFGVGCTAPPPPSTPPPAFSTTAPTSEPPRGDGSASILPVGTPSVLMTVRPPSKATAAPVPLPSPSSAATSSPNVSTKDGLSVSKPVVTHTSYTISSGNAPPQAPPSVPAPTASSAPPDLSMDRMTLPIYPFSTKRTNLTQQNEGAQHLILVLLTRDSLDVVKNWYRGKTRFSAVVDSGSQEHRTVTLSRAAIGAKDPKLVDAVVLQPQPDGSVQITLSAWRSI